MKKLSIFHVLFAVSRRLVSSAGAVFLVTGCALSEGPSLFNRHEGPNGSPRGGNPPSPAAKSRLFFDTTIKPLFERRCASCHNDPRIPGDGPLSIYHFSAMASKLMEGSSNEENSLILKMRNRVPHPGADQCPSGFDATPCKEVKEWWQLEAIARGSSGGSMAPVGSVNAVALDGQITGWAADINEPSAAVRVEFYIDGQKGGSGRLIGTALASLPYGGLNIPGNHGFTFSIPNEHRDRAEHSLFVYGLDTADGRDGRLSNTPRTFRVYPTSTAGRDYFNSSVLPALNSCRNCHTNNNEPMFNYERAFYFLLGNPTPANQGTENNNRFHNKSMGMDHSGGNQCGNGTSGPCPTLREWWRREFN